uniref:Uncharacterized protein n=1 Tax=uncultured Rhodospirillales bacterium HF4000_24M03 TaxID=710788 RepID=E0XW44_9PROT|nr:hypothetical protein [uncultured Rhodospirillales bacterium HF4000_24M03]
MPAGFLLCGSICMGNVGGKDVSHSRFFASVSISLTSPKYPLDLPHTCCICFVLPRLAVHRLA